MIRRAHYVFLALVALSGLAFADDARTIFLQAANSPQGRASGTLSGGDTETYIRRVTGAKKPIRVVVDTVATLSQPGCKRLRATFMLEDAATRDGGITPFWFSSEMNVCAGGFPPVDVGTAGAASPGKH